MDLPSCHGVRGATAVWWRVLGGLRQAVSPGQGCGRLGETSSQELAAHMPKSHWSRGVGAVWGEQTLPDSPGR